VETPLTAATKREGANRCRAPSLPIPKDGVIARSARASVAFHGELRFVLWDAGTASMAWKPAACERVGAVRWKAFRIVSACFCNRAHEAAVLVSRVNPRCGPSGLHPVSGRSVTEPVACAPETTIETSA